MRAVWKSSLVVSFLIFLSNQGFAQNQGLAQTVEDDIVYSASQTLNEIMRIPARGIPRSLLKQAHGIAIIPDLLKGGFIVGVRHGKGVVIAKNKNGDWQGPYFVKLTGGSVGFQAGVQATDVVLVFMSQKSVTGLMRGKFTIGGDVSVAAGPIGRQAAAATDGKLRAEILSYSRSRGLFAGVSIDGAVLSPDQRSTNAYYAPRPGQPQGTVPASATKLMQQVLAYTGNAAPNPENPPKVQPEVTPQQQEQILR